MSANPIEPGELASCPFCGQQPERNDVFAWCWGPARSGASHGLVQMSLEMWNRRPVTPTTPPDTEDSRMLEREAEEAREEYRAHAERCNSITDRDIKDNEIHRALMERIRDDLRKARRGLDIPEHKRTDVVFCRAAASIGKSFVDAALDALTAGEKP